MPGNIEEKEKCLEKLNQMQKYLPFLDFMIDKIRKKNNEISLKCQLSKFQLLRSMISEKNGKYSWDVILKVEDVIEKLISKLDFKEQYEKSKEHLTKINNQKGITSMATSISIVPSSTAVSVTTNSNSQVATVDLKSQDYSTNTVDLIMKTLKISVDSNMRKHTDRGKELSPNFLGPNQSPDVSGQAMETDLEKDLDGFDLTDCPNLSETDSNSATMESLNVVPEKVSFQQDVLSSSREKLLKSLQSKLFPCKTYQIPSQSSVGNKTEKANESQNTCAFSRNQNNICEPKTKSDFPENSEQNTVDKNSKESLVKSCGKNSSVVLNPVKAVNLSEKIRTDLASSSGDFNLKQKLKEKLSTDICEVYRVPGKSVGGSLRSLKESKCRKKSFIVEEDKLFKPDKAVEKKVIQNRSISQLKPSTEKKDSQDDKFYKDSSINTNEKKGEKINDKAARRHSLNNSGKNERSHKKFDLKDFNLDEYKGHKKDSTDIKIHEKKVENKNTKDSKQISPKKADDNKCFELDKLNDNELLEFVKENMQSLPHLAKLKPSELRKEVKSSLLSNYAAFNTDDISEISDDSFQDLDDDVSGGNKKTEPSKLIINPDFEKSSKDKNENKEPCSPASFKLSQASNDDVVKNVKRTVEIIDDTKFSEKTGDKTHDVGDDSLDDNLDEEDYAMKLIEETTLKTYPPKKKKGLLELPMPITEDLFDDISSIESFENSTSPTDNRDSKMTKLFVSSVEGKNKVRHSKSASSSLLNPDLNKITREVWSTSSGHTNPYPSKDTNHGPRLQTGSNLPYASTDYKMSRSNQERSDPRTFKPIGNRGPQDGNQFPQFSSKYSNESKDSKFRNYGKSFITKRAYDKDPRRHSYSSSEPKSYAEYKRRKLKEQEKFSPREQASKENPKNTISDCSKISETSRSSAEKEDDERNTSKKTLDSRHSGCRDSFAKTYNPIRTYEAKKNSHPKLRRHSDHIESRLREDFRERRSHYEEIRKEEDHKIRKNNDEKRHSVESEELVSPLEELYRNEKRPKTGRGYGIQHFKIPKKVREAVSQVSFKSNTDKCSTVSNNSEKKNEIMQSSNFQNETDSTKESKKPLSIQTKEPINILENEPEKETDEITQVSVIESTKIEQSRSNSEKMEFNEISESQMKKNPIDSLDTRNISDKNDEQIESNSNCTNTIDNKFESVESSDSSEQINEAKDEARISVLESVSTPARPSDKDKLKILANDESKTDLNSDKTDALHQTPNLKNHIEELTLPATERKITVDSVKKCEAQIVECDSSIESTLIKQQSSGKDSFSTSDKSTVVSKEEITQEFVEDLIRKSFQSGEGKLLLAQVKVFEELARKLNSKKLKTIQKIINSESDSSTSSSETSSENEKKKRKGKKSEEKSQKAKKRKKKVKSRKKKKSSSSSSSASHGEETSDEENSDKKEDKKDNKKSENCESSAPPDNEESKIQETPISSEESKSKSNESSAVKIKTKKRRRNLEFGRNFSGRRGKRRQKQKLLEHILNEAHPTETNNVSHSETSIEPLAKEAEPKNKPKTKAKVRTELDRLHDDIRSMFISKGVVTATGQRMCRILKNSGGNMNNLDIVKESAKMVEEEKLKKVQTRTSSRNSRLTNTGSSEGKSRGQSLDKGMKTHESQLENEDEQDPKLKLEPRVSLQKVDLDNFGYGIKVSDDCISFRRMQGRNFAIRGVGTLGISANKRSSRTRLNNNLARNVFLLRNKRKFERLRNSNCKKNYVGKKLLDIVKNLTIKMTKMKHSQICEKTIESAVTKKDQSSCEKMFKQNVPQKLNAPKIELSNVELLLYAFEKQRKIYPCKLCSLVTKNITKHYKVDHSEYEVLISRLCIEEAKKAKYDSMKNGYNVDTPRHLSLVESMKRKVNSLLNSTGTYNCRMCCSNHITDINLFISHTIAHTGEFRYQCPAEKCAVQMFSLKEMKFHILLQHSKHRFKYYNRIIELYSATIEGRTLFGFLCSECHFVQICHSNLKKHISRQHNDSERVNIIKINMSSKLSRNVKKKKRNLKNSSKDASVFCENMENKDIIVCSENIQNKDASICFESTENKDASDCSQNIENKTESEKSIDSGSSDTQNSSESVIVIEKTDSKGTLEKDKRKRIENREDDFSEFDFQNNKSGGKDVEMLESGKIFLAECPEIEKIGKKPVNIRCDEEIKDPLDKEDNDIREGESADHDNTCSDFDMEDCADLKSISVLKGNEVMDCVEDREDREFRGRDKTETLVTLGKLKVGPLEAQLLENSEVLYECYIKGCLFSTRDFDLFEKHITISHSKTKWDGICEICDNRKDKPRGKNTFRLLTALKHLKLHEKEKCNGGKLSAEDLIIELKLLNSSDGLIVDEEEFEKFEIEDKPAEEVKGQDQMQAKADDSEAPFPPKPLLRVRNLLGDRLSTPKGEENEVVAVNEEESNTEGLPSNSSMMFTIENVRSLTEASSEESEFKIEQVCSLKNQLPKPVNQLGIGKAIIVRSCPTRKIAIRSEPSTLPVDVGHINVVQPSVVGHPVVLNPISNNSPIRIISAALNTPKPKFSVKPIVVSADTAHLNNPTVMPVLPPTVCPSSSSAVTATTILPVTPASETNSILEQPVPLESNPGETQPLLNVEVISTPSRPKSPSVQTFNHLSKNSSDTEEADEKETITSQKAHSSPNSGKKSVKDAKVYQEMLTKTKLCHLFKCMGIECSFTCNNEHVFTQHIGLHNAQRRLKKAKGMKTIYLRLANKTTRAFYWQQCAYCCEVLSNTNNALSQHILEEHGHCMYQCAFCFYRAVSHSYVEIHQNLAHSQILKTTPRVIYKCKPLKVPPSTTTLLEKHGRKQSVRPYHCDQCGRKFFITHEFIRHLASEHQSVTAYTCHICKNLCFKVNRLINHYKLHSYCTYQCAYCLHGTETEKEMVFHLCNFHFSQPAVMYVRAVAEGQSGGSKQKASKKKKSLTSQLDSLKVIVYETDTLNLDCIVEANSEEEGTENISKTTLDLSALVAELGINSDTQSLGSVTPLMQELSSIGDKSTKSLTVKTLLPNAEFTSENENRTENCSVLISSGLSVPSDQNDEREMNIPLGQLPLEAVNIQHKKSAPPLLPTDVESSDKNLKLNEILMNLQQKDKILALPCNEVEKIGQSSAVHKLPPVVLPRGCVSQISYPSKIAVARKKSVEPHPSSENLEGDKASELCQQASNVGKEKTCSADTTQSTSQRESNVEVSDLSCRKSSVEKGRDSEAVKTSEPLITNVISLSNGEFDKKKSVEAGNTPIIISDICSLSDEQKENSSSSEVVIQSELNCSSILKPPIIRVEDFPIDKDIKPSLKESIASVESKEKNKNVNSEPKKTEKERPVSPDIIILEEEKTKDIVTVILDSDDEKNEGIKKTGSVSKNSKDLISLPKDETIRKEMELLRNQIANETDSLLLDEPAKGIPPKDLLLNVQLDKNDGEISNAKTLLSPIEEAICSLNKKLQSETEQAQKKEEENKSKVDVTAKRVDGCESKVLDRPRTRFRARKVSAEITKKQDKGNGDVKKEDLSKTKRFKEELKGKDLFICGNEKCNFAAEDDSSLKDHLYICDLSRESSVLVCPHCSRQIKQFHPYLEHLRYHGEKKFHCGLCSFSSAVDASVTRHVKQKHKCSLVKTLPKDSKEGHVLYYPKNYKVDRIDFEVNGYSPGDEDKLPLQSVYQVNVKCAKCPYFTKVRSNMVRHLKIHVKSVETEGVVVVPSTAPTNPVPCLETKERMFDKMTNLAASSQLAQAREKTAIESLSPEEEAKLPQFVAEQMRYKCCLPDCNYITVDDGMLKHHIKALHDEINYYSCPHCKNTVHVDVRHVTLDKIGYHLKHHDTKLYKCAHCIYFHYLKNVVEKHTVEKHPDRRFFVHTVREPKPDVSSEEEPSSSEAGTRMWKCGLCNEFKTIFKATLMDHLLKNHNTKSKYKCQFCSMKGNNYQAFLNHFSSKHVGEKMSYLRVYYSEKIASSNLESQSGNSSGADSSNEHFDTTPLWQRGAPRVRHIRGILIEEEEIKTKRSKRTSVDESETDTSETVSVKENVFYCPLCTNKKKPFYTRNEDCFRSHLYQELNYQQFACILCGKMFVDRKDFERHHLRIHSGKPQSLKQTKEDHEIKFWVDQVIAKRKKQMEDRKRKLSDSEGSGSQGPPKKKKEV